MKADPKTDIVQRQLDAYNAQDLDAYCACFTSDLIVADLNGKVTSSGLDAFRARYADVFKRWPGNRARLVNRIRVGATVIDHEDVTRGAGLERFEVAAVYTLRDGKIARIDFVR